MASGNDPAPDRSEQRPEKIAPLPPLALPPKPEEPNCTDAEPASHAHQLVDHRKETFETLFKLLSTCERNVNKAAELIFAALDGGGNTHIQILIEAQTCLKKASESEQLLLQTAPYLPPSSNFESDIKAILDRIRNHQARATLFVEAAKDGSAEACEKISAELTMLSETQVDLFILNQALKYVLDALMSPSGPADTTRGQTRESA